MREWAGKKALVTGGSKRIGRAIALGLARCGADVVVHHRSSGAEAESTADAVREHGVAAWVLQADLADAGAVDRLAGEALRVTGGLDILVNSASTFEESGLREFGADELAMNLQVNAMAGLQLGRALAAQGRSGAILNLLDARMTEYDARHAAYHVSKRAFHTLTRMMALEFAPAVRVNGLAPGLVLSPPGKDEAFLMRYAVRNPLQRVGGLADLVESALFLLRTDFITGQTLFYDGGYHLKGDTYG